MRLLLGALALGLVAACLGAASIFSGVANVAASSREPALIRWVLSTAMERSVRRRAADLRAPGSLDDPGRLRAGLAAYDDMCVSCHGAPGVERSVVGRGQNPEAPELTRTAGEWSSGELFWIIKHGVRMTGMPAFGATHEDQEIWDLVALVRRLPDLSREEYARMRAIPDSARPHAHPGASPPAHESSRAHDDGRHH